LIGSKFLLVLIRDSKIGRALKTGPDWFCQFHRKPVENWHKIQIGQKFESYWYTEPKSSKLTSFASLPDRFWNKIDSIDFGACSAKKNLRK
jgi:hypothetical protein